MKKLISTFLIVVASLALTSVTFAQAAGPTGGAPKLGESQKEKGRPATKLMSAIRGLGLSKEQMKKVRELSSKMREANTEIQNQIKEGKLDKKDAAPKVKENLENFKKGLAEILTPEQMEKLKSAMTEDAKPGDDAQGGKKKKKKGDGGL